MTNQVQVKTTFIKNPKQIFLTAVKIAISIFIIYFMVRSGVLTFENVARVFTPSIFIVGMLLIALNIAFSNQRWRVLLRSQNLEMSFRDSMELTMIGLFFNFLLPGGVGGDVVRAYYVVKQKAQSKVLAGLSILMDRILGLYAMMLIAFVALYLSDVPENAKELILFKHSFTIIFSAFTLALIVLFSTFPQKMGIEKLLIALPKGEKLKKLYLGVHQFGRNPIVIAQVLALSLLAQMSSIFLFVFVGVSMGFDIPGLVHFKVVPLGFIATAIPISPAGIGVGQMAFHFLYNVYGGFDQFGASAITAFQVFQFIFSLLGAFFFLKKKETLKELESAL